MHLIRSVASREPDPPYFLGACVHAVKTLTSLPPCIKCVFAVYKFIRFHTQTRVNYTSLYMYMYLAAEYFK